MNEYVPHRVRTTLLRELKRQPRNGTADIHTLSDTNPRTTRRMRFTWFAVVPSVFVIAFAGLLWLELGAQLATGTVAALQPPPSGAAAEAFLHAPASDASVPRASDVLFPSSMDASAEPVPTF